MPRRLLVAAFEVRRNHTVGKSNNCHHFREKIQKNIQRIDL